VYYSSTPRHTPALPAQDVKCAVWAAYHDAKELQDDEKPATDPPPEGPGSSVSSEDEADVRACSERPLAYCSV
jgi:hypothetical protein